MARLGQNARTSRTSSLATTASSPSSVLGGLRSSARAMDSVLPQVASCLWLPFVSGRASSSGDEAKVTELVDGRILMSIRHAGNRWYNISEDGGETWQPTTSTWYDIIAPACNGDMIRYTSENQGYNKNRLLHSVPYGSNREKVTVYISYDEGETWPVSKCIVPYSSAYSSLCILPDGTIGLYVEEAYAGASGYSTVFYNFSLEWLTDGEDTFEPN